MSGASSVSCYRSPVISCSMSGRTFPFTIFLVTGKHPLPFLRISLVGSTVLSMTYSIKVHPYNDPYVKFAEEALGATAEYMIPGAFLVDSIPILKYVPEWFPGAKFQSKAAMLRKYAAIMRNTPFTATEELMVCDSSPFLVFLLDDTHTFSQASGDYDPSFVTEVLLKEIQHSDTPDQDINLLKDVAAQAYSGQSTHFTSFSPPPFFANGVIPQREQIPLLRQSELFSWRWSAILRCRRKLKQNLTKSSMEDFPNIAISLPFPISQRSLKKFFGMLQFALSILCFLLTVFLDGSLHYH